MSIRALCAGLLAGVSVLIAADTVVVEQIVAKVNGDIITRSELAKLRKQAETELTQRLNNDAAQVRQAMVEREKELLRDKIDSLLLIQRGKDLDVKVDTEISKRLADMQLEVKIADPEKFQQFVRDQTGLSFEDFKQEMKNNLMTQRVIGQEVGSKINIPKEQIADYYEKHKTEFIRKEQMFLREILISTDGKDAAGIAAAEKKAKDVVARARREKFADLVRDNSDATTARQGGDLGAWKKGELRQDMETALWDKPRGYVSDPFRVPAGFLILRVDEHFKEGQAELAEVENEVREKLYYPLFQPRIREYLTQLRKDAFLEIRDGYADTGAAPGKDTRWQDPALLKPDTVSKEEVSTRKRHKKLLWVMPIPGTETKIDHTSSSRG